MSDTLGGGVSRSAFLSVFKEPFIGGAVNGRFVALANTDLSRRCNFRGTTFV